MQFYLWIIAQWSWEQNKLGFETSWDVYEILFNYFVPIAVIFMSSFVCYWYAYQDKYDIVLRLRRKG